MDSSFWISFGVLAVAAVFTIRLALQSWRGDFSRSAPRADGRDGPTDFYLRLAASSVANAISINSAAFAALMGSIAHVINQSALKTTFLVLAVTGGLSFVFFGALSFSIYSFSKPKSLMPPALRNRQFKRRTPGEAD